MKPAFAIAIAGSALVAGCAPLSQAGLVYSSRVQVGLNLEAATPENPGVRINMGVNASDTAYVPVVVGRVCELFRTHNEIGTEITADFFERNRRN